MSSPTRAALLVALALLLSACRSSRTPAWLAERARQAAGLAMPDEVAVGCAFADIDNDGDPDLFVTTVRHGNRLFENLGHGTFRDITAQAGVGYSGHSSGAVFFDYDGDGLLDLFVTNVG